MVYSEVLHFLKNDDSSSIGYKEFNETPEDRYPTFSLCLYSPPEFSLQYRFKKNVKKYLDLKPTELNQLLKGVDNGKDSSTVDSIFTNISQLGYSTFTFQLEYCDAFEKTFTIACTLK